MLHGSGRGDRFHIDYHSDLAAEQVEQDSDTLAVFHAFIETEAAGERAIQNANLVASTEAGPQVELHEAILVFACAQRGNDRIGHRLRHVTVTDET